MLWIDMMEALVNDPLYSIIVKERKVLHNAQDHQNIVVMENPDIRFLSRLTSKNHPTNTEYAHFGIEARKVQSIYQANQVVPH